MAKITIGPKTFASKKTAQSYFRNLADDNVNRELRGEDYKVVKSVLLSRRPNIDPNKDWKIKAMWCLGWNTFHYQMPNGQWDAFSFLKYLKGHRQTPEYEATQALRWEIDRQIKEFREQALADKVNEGLRKLARLDSRKIHVDHVKEFRHLVKEFTDSEGVKLPELEVKEAPEGILKCLVDRELAERWKEFHKNKAQLRLLSKKQNLQRPRPDLVGESRKPANS